MKLKYYLRGFGTGVLFATIILMISFEISKNFSSNGAFASSGNIQTTESADEAESSKEEQTTASEQNTEENQTTDMNQDTTDIEPDSKNEDETTVNHMDNETVTLVITSGMISNTAAGILEELGVVDNGYDFNMYLYNNGYESKLRVGSYEIPKGASYEEIARIITRR